MNPSNLNILTRIVATIITSAACFFISGCYGKKTDPEYSKYSSRVIASPSPGAIVGTWYARETIKGSSDIEVEKELYIRPDGTGQFIEKNSGRLRWVAASDSNYPIRWEYAGNGKWLWSLNWGAGFPTPGTGGTMMRLSESGRLLVEYNNAHHFLKEVFVNKGNAQQLKDEYLRNNESVSY